MQRVPSPRSLVLHQPGCSWDETFPATSGSDQRCPRRRRGAGATVGHMTTPSHIQAVLGYDDIEASQRYLVETFGFAAGELHRAPDGTVVHGEVTTGSTAIWMHRVTREHGLDSPKNLDTSPASSSCT